MKVEMGQFETVGWKNGRTMIAVWSKASHVPVYGWADPDQDDPEDWDLLMPQPDFVVKDKERMKCLDHY